MRRQHIRKQGAWRSARPKTFYKHRKDAGEFAKSPEPEKPYWPIQDKSPNVQSLRRFLPMQRGEEQRLCFQITECVVPTCDGPLAVCRQGGGFTVEKFSRVYGKELVLSAVRHLGVRRGIAMEFLSSSAVRVADSPSIVEHGTKMTDENVQIPSRRHEDGDLRAPNFIVHGEGLLLVDYD